MDRPRQDDNELTTEMLEIYRRTNELGRRATVPALAKALELAAMHLHQALWNVGADVDLSPELDAQESAKA